MTELCFLMSKSQNSMPIIYYPVNVSFWNWPDALRDFARNRLSVCSLMSSFFSSHFSSSCFISKISAGLPRLLIYVLFQIVHVVIGSACLA